MAIKASATITLSFMVDVKATYRYYKLQSSTESAPSIPTSATPTGWTDTEPTYTEGSTNTLYIVDKTVFTNDTFLYSAVSKSTSYEAAKAAYNKAVNAQNSANSAKEYTDAVKSQYGYRYKKDIIVYGDSTSKYYPVYFAYGNQEISREIVITRNVFERAPSDWHDSYHKGALNFKIKANYGNWGGSTYKCEILDLSEHITKMVADVKVGVLHGYGLCVWLRGGGTTGALYHVYSDQQIEYTADNAYWHTAIPIIAPEEGAQIGWNGGTEENPSYKWIADAALDSPNTDRLKSLQALETAKSAIKNVDVEYYLSTSATSLSGGFWSTTAPIWVNGKYMWSRTKTTTGSGTITYNPSENGVCIAGATGATGATGTGISSITEEYYLSTSKTSQTGGSWSTTPPTWSSGKYIWTRSKIVYSNPSSTAYTTPICDSSWEAVNEVQVGGRNLILNSDRWKYSGYPANGITSTLENGVLKVISTSGNNNHHQVPISNVIENNINDGDPFTFSVEIRSEDSTTLPKIYFKSGMGYYYFNGSISSNYSWLRYTGIWKKANNIDFHFGWGGCSGTYYIRKIKFEKGNKATDWTPAPEDVDSEFDDIRTTYTKSVDLERTNEAFQMNFKIIQNTITTNQNGVTEKFKEINDYIRFEGANIILGKQNNSVTCNISNDRISFLQNGD